MILVISMVMDVKADDALSLSLSLEQACHFDPDASIFLTCPHESRGLTCPTRERLREFIKDGSRSLTCPRESAGPTCPTRDPMTSLLSKEFNFRL